MLLSQQPMRSFENLVGLVETYVDRIDKFINRYQRQLIDRFDVAMSQALSSNLIQCKAIANVSKCCLAASHHCFKLRSGCASGLLCAAYVDVPADKLRRQPHVLSLLSDG